MRLFTLFILIVLLVEANEIDSTQKSILIKRGKKIAHIFCEQSKLPKAQSSVEALAKEILKSSACSGIDLNMSLAVAYYLQNRSQLNIEHIEVPKDAKCPVCGMFVKKYPKWTAVMQIDGKKYYFDGVKDMLKYYFFDKDFPYDRSKITEVTVSDYYTLEAIDATKAYYVVGSNVYGPMGSEFIPFKTKDEAENFLKEHAGKKIVQLKDITAQMVLSLDKR